MKALLLDPESGFLGAQWDPPKEAERALPRVQANV